MVETWIIYEGKLNKKMFYQTHSSKFHTVINTSKLCSDTVKELLLLSACSYLFLIFTGACRHLQANLSSTSTNRTTSASHPLDGVIVPFIQ